MSPTVRLVPASSLAPAPSLAPALVPAASLVPDPVPDRVPDRPRLPSGRAVLRRADGAVQVGLDPARAVVLDGLDPPLRALVIALDGSRRREELVAEAVGRGGDPRIVADLLVSMAAGGLLRGAVDVAARLGPDADARPPTGAGPVGRALGGRGAAVVVISGAGRVGVAIACLLAGAGVGRVHVRGAGTVTGADTGTGLIAADVGRPRAEAAAEAVARAADGAAAGPAPAAGRPAVRPSPRRADVEVLADSEVADAARLRTLATRGRPHLAARVREGVGLVGPFVRPGTGACLRCVELARADDDPDWPWLAAQLSSRSDPTPLAVALATAALAADQVLAALDARPAASATDAPPLLEGTVAEVDLRGAAVRHHRVAVHPLCRCVPAARRERARAA